MSGHPGHSGCSCQGSQHTSSSPHRCRSPVSALWSGPVCADRDRRWDGADKKAGGRGFGAAREAGPYPSSGAAVLPSPAPGLGHHRAMVVTHVVGQPADPAGEAFRVRLQPALPVPRRGHPAVVNADELVAGVPPAVGDHPVRHLHEQLLAAGKKAENV